MRRAGGVWSQEAIGLTTQDVVAVFGPNEDSLFALGRKGAVLRRNGGSWASSPISQLSGSAAGIAGSLNPTTGEMWIAGTRGTILRQMGSSWQSEPTLTTQPFSGLAVAGSNDIYVVGPSGLILHKF